MRILIRASGSVRQHLLALMWRMPNRLYHRGRRIRKSTKHVGYEERFGCFQSLAYLLLKAKPMPEFK